MSLFGGLTLGTSPQTLPALVVTGEGSVDVVPDTAVVSLGVTARSPQATAAFQAASAQLTRVVSALLTAGVPREQIQTSQVSLQPAFEDGRQAGFEATATVQVTLRDVSTVGPLIDRAVAAGANSVAGIRFEVRDPGAAEAQALSLAVQNAQRQAVALARSLGVTLGPVVRAEAEPGGGVGPVFARAAAGDALPVLPGTQTITRRVRTEFLIGR